MSCVDILHLSSIWPFLLRSCLIFYSYTLSSTLLSLLSWTNCLSWHHKLSVACSSCKFHVFSKCDSQRLRYCFVWLHVQTSAVDVSTSRLSSAWWLSLFTIVSPLHVLNSAKHCTVEEMCYFLITLMIFKLQSQTNKFPGVTSFSLESIPMVSNWSSYCAFVLLCLHQMCV